MGGFDENATLGDFGGYVQLTQQVDEQARGVEVVGGAVVEYASGGAVGAPVGIVGDVAFQVADEGDGAGAGRGGQALDQGADGGGLVLGDGAGRGQRGRAFGGGPRGRGSGHGFAPEQGVRLVLGPRHGGEKCFELGAQGA